MKLNETIELNGKEYTVELNRESIVRIEQYTNLKESSKILQKEIIKDKSNEEITSGENPFEDEIDDSKIEELGKQKEEILKKIFVKAFWIWLYPVEKLNYEEVNEILDSYFKDEEKANYIAEKYQYFSSKSIEIREQYLEEQKNLKALTK